MSLHFIIDGYNLIKQDSKLADLKLEIGRQKLISSIISQRWCGSSRNRVTIVFDGKGFFEESMSQSGIQIVFTCHETADERIKRIVTEDQQPRNIVVVTDDREIQFFVRALGARIKGVKEFKSQQTQKRAADLLPGHPAVAEHKTLALDQSEKITSELANLWLKKKKSK